MAHTLHLGEEVCDEAAGESLAPQVGHVIGPRRACRTREEVPLVALGWMDGAK